MRHKVEFIAGGRVHSRNWSQVPFFAPVELNLVSVGLLWSDEDGGDELEDRRTSSQARREYEDLAQDRSASRDGVSRTTQAVCSAISWQS